MGFITIDLVNKKILRSFLTYGGRTVNCTDRFASKKIQIRKLRCQKIK